MVGVNNVLVLYYCSCSFLIQNSTWRPTWIHLVTTTDRMQCADGSRNAASCSKETWENEVARGTESVFQSRLSCSPSRCTSQYCFSLQGSSSPANSSVAAGQCSRNSRALFHFARKNANRSKFVRILLARTRRQRRSASHSLLFGAKLDDFFAWCFYGTFRCNHRKNETPASHRPSISTVGSNLK